MSTAGEGKLREWAERHIDRINWEYIWSAISKLESQISRNPSLPESYSAIVKRAFVSVRYLQRKAGELREERDALKKKLDAIHAQQDLFYL